MKELLKDGFSELGINVSDDKIEKLIIYAELLKNWNEKMNLTAVCDDSGLRQSTFSTAQHRF